MNSVDVFYKVKTASQQLIFLHLAKCNDRFIPPLTDRVDIGNYSEKIFEKAVTFEAWSQDRLIGLVAAYLNDPYKQCGYVTNVSVDHDFAGGGHAKELLFRCLKHAHDTGFKNIQLEVAITNIAAISLYLKYGFKITEGRGDSQLMSINLKDWQDGVIS